MLLLEKAIIMLRRGRGQGVEGPRGRSNGWGQREYQLTLFLGCDVLSRVPLLNATPTTVRSSMWLWFPYSPTHPRKSTGRNHIIIKFLYETIPARVGFTVITAPREQMVREWGSTHPSQSPVGHIWQLIARISGEITCLGLDLHVCFGQGRIDIFGPPAQNTA